MSRQSKRIIDSREKLLLANDLEKIQTLVKIYIKEKKLNKLKIDDILDFFIKWVEKRNKLEELKPYRLNLMQFMTSKIIKYFLKDMKDLPIIRQKLKKQANTLARTMYTDKIWAPHKFTR